MLTSPVPEQPTTDATVVLSNDDADAEVLVRQDASNLVEFSSELPPEWQYIIAIDANKDRVWGHGLDIPHERVITGDKKFGLSSDSFCAQYILTASSKDPSAIFAASLCGALPSQGRVTLGELNADNRRKVVFSLPVDEVFGSDSEAYVVICLWSEVSGTVCEQSVDEPLVLKRK